MATPKKKTAAKKSTGRVTPPKVREALPTLDDVTPDEEWLQDSEPVPLRVPSGKVALVRQVDMRQFMTADVMPNALMPIIQEAMDAQTGPKKKDMQAMASNPEAIQEMMDFLDKVALICVVKPELTPAPVPDPVTGVVPERVKGVLYVDRVVLEDKLFIFQWAVGGTRDLERFREELTSDMERLPTR